jgi:hypothetical protein
LEKKGENFPGSPSINTPRGHSFLVQGGEKQVFDWAIFLKIIIAIFQAILQNLPVV